MYSWNFGDGKGLFDEFQPQPYTYETYGVYDISLQVSYGPCTDEQVRTISIEPIIPEVDFDCDPKAGCRPLTVKFSNLSNFADADSYQWEFGDGQGMSGQASPTYTYYEPGVYTVKLTASNKIGKKVVKEKQQLIRVYDLPYANFRVNPTEVFLPDKPIFTTNLSFGAVDYLWDFGDGNTSNQYEPEHIYQEAGNYDIRLTVTSDKGCKDSVLMAGIVDAIEGGKTMIPNVFTPNSDGPTGGTSSDFGSNDVFLPVMEGVVEYNMQIYNRWGEMLFETNSREVGWDGYFKGKLCSQDVYIYKIRVKYITGEQSTKVGDVTLLR